MPRDRRAKLQMALDATTQHREQLDSEVAKSELALEEQMEALETASWDYNKSADQLQLIPSTAKRAAGVEFEMAVNRNATNGHETLSVDLKVLIAYHEHMWLPSTESEDMARSKTVSKQWVSCRVLCGLPSHGSMSNMWQNGGQRARRFSWLASSSASRRKA